MSETLKDFKCLCSLHLILAIIRFFKFFGLNPRMDAPDLRNDFFSLFDCTDKKGNRIGYSRIHNELMRGNWIYKRIGYVVERIYDELY